MIVLRNTGFRFLAEILLIVATALVAGVVQYDGWVIAGAVAVLWVAIAVDEYSVSRRRGGRSRSVRGRKPVQSGRATVPVPLPQAPRRRRRGRLRPHARPRCAGACARARLGAGVEAGTGAGARDGA